MVVVSGVVGLAVAARTASNSLVIATPLLLVSETTLEGARAHGDGESMRESRVE